MKRFWILFCLLLTVAVATRVAAAQVTTLSNSEEPGSVLVFPLFETGTVATTDQGTVPRSAFKISVVCPPGQTCTDGDDVDIKVEWVCPATTGSTNPCVERDFILNTTVKGSVLFNPGSTTCVPGPGFQNLEGCGTVQRPACSQGYLIAWVVNENGQNVKYDGLIGDAVIRESPGALTAYNAIPVQASTAVPHLAVVPSSPSLAFDGASYQQVTGKIYGDVRYDVLKSGFDADRTALILLTLDSLSNRPNYPVFVNLNFYDDVEQVSSESTEFTCWGETRNLGLNFEFGLSSANKGPKGLVESTSASKVAVNGIQDTAGPVTLIGLIISREYDPTSQALLRNYTYPFLNDSVGVPTTFVP